MPRIDSPAAQVFFQKLHEVVGLLERMARRDDLPADLQADVIVLLLEVGRASKGVLAEANSNTPPIEEMN